MIYGSLHKAVYRHARHRKGFWFLIPELSYNGWIADFIGFRPRGVILEIEIKHSWPDYKADYNKCCHAKQDKRWRRLLLNGKRFPTISKAEWLCGNYPCGRWRPTHFVYAAPKEIAEKIIADPNLPKPFGVWSFEDDPDDKGGYCYSKCKNMARLIKPQPEWVGKMNIDIFKRARNMMDASAKKEFKEEVI